MYISSAIITLNSKKGSSRCYHPKLKTKVLRDSKYRSQLSMKLMHHILLLLLLIHLILLPYLDDKLLPLHSART